MIGGELGDAQVLSDDGTTIVLRFAFHMRSPWVMAPGDCVPIGRADCAARPGAPPPQLLVELVLAMPRPKVLSRVIEACAAFGIPRIDLTNAWRVDKGYLRSPRTEPGALLHAARLGAEQGATTHLPTIHVHERLMGLLDDRFPSPGGVRLIAHPGAPPIEEAVTTRSKRVLAIGPEGGWIDRELETFISRGFTPVSLGTPILRVESAVPVALGQLALLDRQRI